MQIRTKAADTIVFVCAFCLVLLQTCLGSFRCLSCMEIARPRYCEYIQTCGEHGECFVDSYATVSGTVRYNVGCRDKKICALAATSSRGIRRYSPGQIPICNECCEGDLCNQQGCGETGFPNPSQICFNCKQQLHPTDCDKVTVCKQNEVCKMYTQEIAGDTIFGSSCELELVCNRDYDQIVGKRDNSCVHCCNSTLCNDRCRPSIVKCEDKLQGCFKYGREICRPGHPYYSWANTYCLEFCGLCSLCYEYVVTIFNAK